MKYRVVFHPMAQSELDRLYDPIANATSAVTAWNYVEGIEAYCKGFPLPPTGNRTR